MNSLQTMHSNFTLNCCITSLFERAQNLFSKSSGFLRISVVPASKSIVFDIFFIVYQHILLGGLKIKRWTKNCWCHLHPTRSSVFDLIYEYTTQILYSRETERFFYFLNL